MTEMNVLNSRHEAATLVRDSGEPRALAEKRREALEGYRRSPLPDRVSHLWRYTDPREFVPSESAIEAACRGAPGGDRALAGAAIPPALEACLERGEAAGVAFFAPDRAPWLELDLRLKSKGVLLLDLREAVTRAPDLVSRHLGRIVSAQVASDGRGKFEALNLALWSSGLFVHVPANVKVDKPLHVWRQLPGTLPHQLPATFPHQLPGGVSNGVSQDAPESPSQGFLGTRLLEREGGEEGFQLNEAVELFAGEASRLRYVSVDRLGQGVTHHVAQRTSAGRDSRILTAMASLGGATTKADFGCLLDGPGAEVELFGFLYGEGRQHFDHHTVHDHRAAHTQSNLDFKVVLKDKARSAYTGLIRIAPDAPESEAYQENRNLLLNEGARAESIPELEILTDAVKCTHGATVGTLDAEHVFYLMSRGLTRSEAIRLIVGGFIEPTLTHLPQELAVRLRHQMEERIAGLCGDGHDV
jgi:Fe-S cluster assembly protein SufD